MAVENEVVNVVPLPVTVADPLVTDAVPVVSLVVGAEIVPVICVIVAFFG